MNINCSSSNLWNPECNCPRFQKLSGCEKVAASLCNIILCPFFFLYGCKKRFCSKTRIEAYQENEPDQSLVGSKYEAKLKSITQVSSQSFSESTAERNGMTVQVRVVNESMTI